MKITIDRDSWIAGFRDGEKSRPSRYYDFDGYSYTSGWIEGNAKRQGCSYSLGTLKPEDIWPELRRDPNYGNPFEPPETQDQRQRRVGRMIRENVDERLAQEAAMQSREVRKEDAAEPKGLPDALPHKPQESKS